MKKNIYIIAILVVLLGVLFILNQNGVKQGVSQFAESYKDATYIIGGKVLRFKNGGVSFENSNIRYFGNEVKTDIDGDGREDVAFLITQKNKSTDNIFYYFVGALNTEKGYVGTEALFLGDRIAPQTTEKGIGRIVIVNYADRKTGEGFEVEPSIGKSVWLLLDTATMQWGEVVQNFEGEADPGRMSLTMKTWTWVRAEFGDDAFAMPQDPKKFTITFGKDGKFSATTDCNGVGGGYVAKDGKIEFGEMMSTLMFCEDSQESVFRKILDDAEGYTFTGKGELVFGLKWNGTAVFR